MAPKQGKAIAYEGAHMVCLVDKDLTAFITDTFKELKETIPTELKEGYDDDASPKREPH